MINNFMRMREIINLVEESCENADQSLAPLVVVAIHQITGATLNGLKRKSDDRIVAMCVEISEDAIVDGLDLMSRAAFYAKHSALMDDRSWRLDRLYPTHLWKLADQGLFQRPSRKDCQRSVDIADQIAAKWMLARQRDADAEEIFGLMNLTSMPDLNPAQTTVPTSHLSKEKELADRFIRNLSHRNN